MIWRNLYKYEKHKIELLGAGVRGKGGPSPEGGRAWRGRASDSGGRSEDGNPLACSVGSRGGWKGDITISQGRGATAEPRAVLPQVQQTTLKDSVEVQCCGGKAPTVAEGEPSLQREEARIRSAPGSLLAGRRAALHREQMCKKHVG